MIDMLFHLRVYALSEYGMTLISHMLLFSSPLPYSSCQRLCDYPEVSVQ